MWGSRVGAWVEWSQETRLAPPCESANQSPREIELTCTWEAWVVRLLIGRGCGARLQRYALNVGVAWIDNTGVSILLLGALVRLAF